MKNFIIEAPEPFIRTFQEGLDKDIHDIQKYYDEISTTSNFSLSQNIKLEDMSYLKKTQEVLKAARQTMLLYMSTQTEYSLFNFQSISTIFHNTQQEPKLYFDEPVKFLFGKISAEPESLSGVMRNYFSQNISYLYSFCWSTFPSIYNFFTSDIHVEAGYKLIMQFLHSFTPVDIKILDYLLPPYFFCSFQFLSKFWTKVNSEISKHCDEKNDIFNLMINCITSCSIFLSSCHKSIITNLYNTTPNRCIEFLFNKFLKPSFEIILKNDQFLFTSNEIEIIQKFIEKYSKSTITDSGKKIIHAFTLGNNKIDKDKNDISVSVPLTPGFNNLNQIKSIISFYDIGLLCEMYVFYEKHIDYKFIKTEQFKSKVDPSFQKGFEPIYVSKTNKINSEVREKIFPKEYQSFWNSILSLAEGKNIDPLQFYIQHIQLNNEEELSIKNNFSSNNLLLANFHDESKNKFVYLYQIHSFENNYKTLDNLLQVRTRIKENEELLSSIKIFHKSIISDCCEKMKNKALNDFISSGKIFSYQIANKIAKAIEIISSDNIMNEMPSFIKFCSILNSFDIEADENYINLTDGFMNLIDDQKNEIFILVLPYRKNKIILDSLCNRYKEIFELDLLGKKFSAIMKLIEFISIISSGKKKGNKSKFSLYFKYILCVCNNPIFFNFYLIMRMILKKNKKMLSFFDKKNKKNYLIFDNAMKEFLGQYKFGIRCLSYIQSCV